MKCLVLLAILSIFNNILITQSQNVNEQNLSAEDVTENIRFNSILNDINNFYNKNAKYQVVAAAETENTTTNSNTSTNAGGNTSTSGNTSTGGNANANTNTNGGNNANTSTNTNGNTNGNTNNNNANGNTTTTKTVSNNNDTNDDKTLGDDEEEPIKETGCGSDRSSLGMFAFHKPIKRSILAINSNFTIVWSYNNILEGYEYNYPQNEITLKLFYEDDANPNNWANAWKNPVMIKNIKMAEVEKGAVIKGIQTYQYNWQIDPAETLKNLKTNEKYKLRIYGDGKDVQSNSANFTCYDNGDIQPGLTVAFYIVDNNHIQDIYYRPIAIEDNKNAGIQNNTSIIITSLIAILLMLYNYW